MTKSGRETIFAVPGHAWIISFVLIVFLILGCASSRTAAPRPDEAGLANPGYNLGYNGFPGTTVYETTGFMPESLRRVTYWHLPLYFYVTAGFSKLIGFGLFQIRAISMVFALIGLVSWYVLAGELCRSPRAGLLAMGFVSLDYFYLFSASGGRMDIMCSSLGTAALAAFMRMRRNSLTRSIFWAHVLVTLSMLTHPAGVLYYLNLLTLIFLFDRKSLSRRDLVAALIPATVGILLLGAYISQDVGAFAEQMRATVKLNSESFNDPGLSGNPYIRLAQLEIRHRYIEPFGLGPGVGAAQRLKAVVLGAYLLAIAGGFFLTAPGRARAWIMPLLALIAIGFLAFFSPSKFPYYLVHTTGFMAASLGCFVFYLTSNRSRHRLGSLIAPAALVLVGGIQLAGSIYQISRDPYDRSFIPALAAVRGHSTPRSTVMGSAELWFGLEHDRHFVSDFNLGALTSSRPDVFVMDAVFRNLHESARASDPARFEKVEKLLAASTVIWKDSTYEVHVAK